MSIEFTWASFGVMIAFASLILVVLDKQKAKKKDEKEEQDKLNNSAQEKEQLMIEVQSMVQNNCISEVKMKLESIEQKVNAMFKRIDELKDEDIKQGKQIACILTIIKMKLGADLSGTMMKDLE
jgi:septal ring factor EnvC (AmiA/AmiB activator)